jgi:glucose-1-phosphate cytidylyltransferase
MKVVILAGGLGTRLSEETAIRPKPMVEIGGRPILWHIMKHYAVHGFTDFIVCLGYKGYVIKEFFANYYLHMSDVTFELSTGTLHVHHSHTEPWSVTLVDTGETTMTGGRIKRVAPYIGHETFLCTYGDGIGNVDIGAELAFHRAHGRLATMTVVQPPGRFGAVVLDGERITSFMEKPRGDGGWINGGYFVLEPEVIDRIEGDATVFEREPLESLARLGELQAFRHQGFWHPLDTLRDKLYLEDLWRTGDPPWRTWV